jgi:hypothetical protein
MQECGPRAEIAHDKDWLGDLLLLVVWIEEIVYQVGDPDSQQPHRPEKEDE